MSAGGMPQDASLARAPITSAATCSLVKLFICRGRGRRARGRTRGKPELAYCGPPPLAAPHPQRLARPLHPPKPSAHLWVRDGVVRHLVAGAVQGLQQLAVCVFRGGEQGGGRLAAVQGLPPVKDGGDGLVRFGQDGVVVLRGRAGGGERWVAGCASVACRCCSADDTASLPFSSSTVLLLTVKSINCGVSLGARPPGAAVEGHTHGLVPVAELQVHLNHDG